MQRFSLRLLALFTLTACAAGSMLAAYRDDPEPATLDDLKFMAGHWRLDRAGTTVEEVWLPLRGGMMIGVNRTTTANQPTQFEYLRIEERDGVPVYVASPGGKGATAFPLKSHAGKKVVFENPAHDFPKRIIYERKGDTMTASIEGDGEGEHAMSWQWQLAAALE